MRIIILLILALLPGVLLLWYILHMDRHEREPFPLVLKVMAMGALSMIPVALIEMLLGVLPIYHGLGRLWTAVSISFIQVAPVEELAKLVVVLVFAWRNKNFNEPNDGIVYTGAAALGFAMLENVLYVLSKGVAVGILRAMTAMPLHCFTGVIMGYFVGKARFSGDYRAARAILIKGFLWAYFIHGLYDTFLFTQTDAAYLIFPLVVALVILGIRVMKKSRTAALASMKVGAESDDRDSGSPAAGSSGDTAVEQRPEPVGPTWSKQTWKAVVARVLLVICVLFWVLVIVGIALSDYEGMSEIMEPIMGGILLSFTPILIGVFLEISYRRNRKRLQALEQRPTQPPG